MPHRNEKRTLEVAQALLEESLPDVVAEFDDTDTCYLSGKAATPDDQAHAVEIANSHGAQLVVEGIEVPGQEVSHMHRRHFVERPDGSGTRADTPAGRILGAAHLTDRVFDARPDRHSGTLIATNET